jgi:hypothetical protein
VCLCVVYIYSKGFVNHHAQESLQNLYTILSSLILVRIGYSFSFFNPFLPLIKSYCVTYLGFGACLHLVGLVINFVLWEDEMKGTAFLLAS